jgi:hypothetical protein
MFKSSTKFIQILFSEQLVFWFRLYVQQWSCLKLFRILWTVLLCWTVKSETYARILSLLFFRATFHIGIVYEHIFQYLPHMLHFNTGNNKLLITQASTIARIKETWDLASP